VVEEQSILSSPGMISVRSLLTKWLEIMQIGIMGFYEELSSKPFWLENKSLVSNFFCYI